MVAGDGDRVGSSTTFNKADALADAFAKTGWATVSLIVNDDLFTLGMVAMVWVERVHDTVRGALKAAAEGVVMTLVVVVTHVSLWGVDCCFGFDSYLFAGTGGADTLVFDVVGRLEALTIVTFGGVDSCVLTVDFDVNLCFWVALVRFSVSVIQ